MTEAEKKAREYAERETDFIPVQGWLEQGFLAGFLAGQQSQWTEYPQGGPPKYNQPVLLELDSGRYLLAMYDEDDDNSWFEEVGNEEDPLILLSSVKRWMPINLPTLKEGA